MALVRPQAGIPALTVLAVLCTLPAHAQGIASGDFNGDGRRDLAIGVPDEDITVGRGTAANAGAVHIFFGGAAKGLSSTGSEFLFEGGPDVADAAEAGDQFGYALAAGDFNGDTYDDLAVGVPGQRVGVDAGAGSVHVFYGSAAGLVAVGVLGAVVVNDVVWHRDSAGVRETADPGDAFGWSLTSGHFNRDKYADLAIGVPNDDPIQSDAGSVHVLHGSSTGLVATDVVATAAVNEDDQVWHQDVGHTAAVAEPGDHFGWAVAAGDFDGDGRSDLAIGAPGESVGPGVDPDWDAGPQDAGAVVVLNGSDAGLTDAGSEAWHQATSLIAGLIDTAEEGDGFGYSLAVGDFDGNGCDDLAVGVPFEDDEGGGVAIRLDAGAIHVLYGFPDGHLQYTNEQFWHQNSLDLDGEIADVREPGDAFGMSLAAGDLNGDGADDLVVGVPLEDVLTAAGQQRDAGVAHVLYGLAAAGITLAGSQLWHQDRPGVADITEAGDLFARSLAVGDFNGDTYADVAVGIPGESITSGGVAWTHAGAVSVLHGSSAGISANDNPVTLAADENDQFWHQDSANIADATEKHDHFGGGRVSP